MLDKSKQLLLVIFLICIIVGYKYMTYEKPTNNNQETRCPTIPTFDCSSCAVSQLNEPTDYPNSTPNFS